MVGGGGRERRSNLRWTRNTSFVTLMHPPEAASGALRSRGSDCRRAEEARAESYRSMLLLLMMLTTMMMMLITIRQDTRAHAHTRAHLASPSESARAGGRGTGRAPLVVCGARAYTGWMIIGLRGGGARR